MARGNSKRKRISMVLRRVAPRWFRFSNLSAVCDPPAPGPMEGSLEIINGVLVGKDGELFLAGGGHSVLDFATGKIKPSEESIRNLARNLETRRNRAKSEGFRFCHVIAPEKYRVYPELFPVSNPTSLARQYIRGGCEGFLDPVDELMAESAGRTYGINDTHWAAHGKIVVSRLLAKEAGIDPARVEISEHAARSSLEVLEKPFAGDLGNKLQPPVLENAYYFKRTFPHKMIENGITHDTTRPVNDGRLIYSLSEAPSAVNRRLLIFGDSYLHLTLPALAFFFSEVLFCRTRWFHPEVIQMFRPDMVVSQQAERYLSFVFPDEHAPNFFLVPYVLGRQPTIAPEDAEVLSKALNCGREIDNGPLRR